MGFIRLGLEYRCLLAARHSGLGKSTVALTVSEDSRLQEYLAGYFFFQRENINRYDILQIIAYKLSEYHPGFAKAVAARLTRPRPTLRAVFNELILRPVLEAQEGGHLHAPIIFVLDALDEYGDFERRVPLSQVLKTDFRNLPPYIRFLVTSRPEGDLMRDLKGDHILNRVLMIDDQSRRDVDLYLHVEMGKIFPGMDVTRIASILSTAADGLFIWAKLAVDTVAKIGDKLEFIYGLERTRKLTLDDLYNTALQYVDLNWEDEDTRELFKKIFAIVLPNRGVLTTSVLDGLLTKKPHTSLAFLNSLQSFVTASEASHVQIHHKTFAEFLAKPTSPWHVDVQAEASSILDQLFVSLDGISFNFGQSLTCPGIKEARAGDVREDLIYAILYWSNHLRDADFSPGILEELRRFVSTQLIFWLEALSYLREFSRVASPALIRVIEWTSVSDPSAVYLVLCDLLLLLDS